MVIGSVVILATGWAWYTILTNTPANVSFKLAVLQFIPGDIIKIALAAAVLPTGWALLKRKASGDGKQ
jgi:biotin transporter BioY